MLLCKTLQYETSESINEVIRKLRQVIETKHEKNKSSHYKGEFVKEGFILVTKMSAASMPTVFIFGQFINTKDGTKINITVQLPTVIKVLFWVFNAILGFRLVMRYLNSLENWPLFLVFLVFLWLFFQFQLWLEVKSLKSILDPIFFGQVK
jgi:hypothetical protein